jgi:hypothetical protein
MCAQGDTLFGVRQVILHVADGLLQQLLGLLDLIQNGVKVRFEEPRYTID